MITLKLVHIRIKKYLLYYLILSTLHSLFFVIYMLKWSGLDEELTMLYWLKNIPSLFMIYAISSMVAYHYFEKLKKRIKLSHLLITITVFLLIKALIISIVSFLSHDFIIPALMSPLRLSWEVSLYIPLLYYSISEAIEKFKSR